MKAPILYGRRTEWTVGQNALAGGLPTPFSSQPMPNSRAKSQTIKAEAPENILTIKAPKFDIQPCSRGAFENPEAPQNPRTPKTHPKKQTNPGTPEPLMFTPPTPPLGFRVSGLGFRVKKKRTSLQVTPPPPRNPRSVRISVFLR